MTDTLLTVTHLRVELSNSAVLTDLSLDARAGDLIGFLGPNGIGKSTALKAIAGLICPARGTITARGTIYMVPQRQVLFDDLSIEDHLRLLNMLDKKREFVEIIEMWMRLPKLSRKTKTLSGGEKRLIALALAFVCRRSIMLLDEPFAQLRGEVATAVSIFLNDYLRVNSACAIIAEHRLNIAQFTRTVTFPQ